MQREKTPTCPKCGSIYMQFMNHLKMYGGYLCTDCGSIWSIEELKNKRLV